METDPLQDAETIMLLGVMSAQYIDRIKARDPDTMHLLLMIQSSMVETVMQTHAAMQAADHTFAIAALKNPTLARRMAHKTFEQTPVPELARYMSLIAMRQGMDMSNRPKLAQWMDDECRRWVMEQGKQVIARVNGHAKALVNSPPHG